MASASYFSLWDIEQLKAAIFNAYANTGAGTNACLQLNQAMASMTPQEVYNMCEALDNTGMIRNSLNQVYPTAVNGALANGVTVTESFATGEQAAIEAASIINSNTTAAAARNVTMEIPANFTRSGGVTSVTAGAKVAEGASAGATVPTVLGHLATGIVGAAVGLKVGVWLDGIAYNLAPDFWDAHNLSEVNPETWHGNIIGEGLLKWADYPETAVLMDNNGQFYADQDMFALMVKYLAVQGALNDNRTIIDNDVASGDLNNTYSFTSLTGSETLQSISAAYPNSHNIQTVLHSGNAIGAFIKASNVQTAAGDLKIFYASDEPFSIEFIRTYVSPPPTTTIYSAQPITAKNGERYYYCIVDISGIPFIDTFAPPINVFTCSNTSGAGMYADLAYILCNGSEHRQEQLPGFNTFGHMPEGITPTMEIPDVLSLLRAQYPELFDNSLKNSVIQPDGTITDHYYLPIGMPEGGTDTQPTSKPENKDAVDPKNEDQTKRATKAVTPTDDTGKTGGGDSDTGTGKTPVLTPPTGTASALYAIYNPTVQQVKDLGAWLWSPNFVDQILKLFSNPMEAIISLHKIYGTPHTAAPQNIKVGYLDSGVSAKVVDQQYINIDCGTVNMYEAFGNIFDYTPYTEVSLYLPFIGIVNVDVADVMRGKCKVIYHIDVITGAVLAEVHVIRDNGAGGVIYQYTGSCAEHYPLSSGSYIGIVTGAAGIAAGVAGTVLSGGALAPMLLGGAASVGSMHTNIQKSGGFSANAGAMGIKKPYFIVSRPQSAMSNLWQKYGGMGANTYVKLASCAGFTRVKYVHLDNIAGACREDLDAIENILKAGVII